MANLLEERKAREQAQQEAMEQKLTSEQQRERERQILAEMQRKREGQQNQTTADGKRNDPEFEAHRQLKAEAEAQGLEISQTRHKTTVEGDQIVTRSQISNRGLQLSKAEMERQRREAQQAAMTQAEFAAFQQAKEAGARQGYDVSSVKVRSAIEGDTVTSRVESAMFADNLKIGSLTRSEAIEQFRSAPISISISRQERPDMTRGAADFPTMTPARGIFGAAGVAEGFTEYGKYTRISKKEPIGYVSAGFDPDRSFKTEVTINKKGTPFMSAGKELFADFVPEFGGTPYNPGRMTKRDMLGPGDGNDPRSFIDAEARNLAVMTQEIFRGNPTFDPYKKYGADLAEVQKGGAIFRPEVTPAGSGFEFLGGTALDFFSGKGFDARRFETLKTELTENPARTFGSIVGAVPFYAIPFPAGKIGGGLKAGASKMQNTINVRLVEASLLGRSTRAAIDKARPETSSFRFFADFERMEKLDKEFGPSFERSLSLEKDLTKRMIPSLGSTQARIDITRRLSGFSQTFKVGERPFTEKDAFGATATAQKEFDVIFGARGKSKPAPELTSDLVPPVEVPELGIKATFTKEPRSIARFSGAIINKPGKEISRIFVQGNKRSIPVMPKEGIIPDELLASGKAPFGPFQESIKEQFKGSAGIFGALGVQPGKAMPRMFVPGSKRSIESFGFEQEGITPLEELAAGKAPFFEAPKSVIAPPKSKGSASVFGAIGVKAGEASPRVFVPGSKRSVPSSGFGELSITPLEELAAGKAPIFIKDVERALESEFKGSASNFGVLGTKPGQSLPRVIIPGTRITIPNDSFVKASELSIDPTLFRGKAPFDLARRNSIFGDIIPFKLGEKPLPSDLQKLMRLEESRPPIFDTAPLLKQAELEALIRSGLKNRRLTSISDTSMREIEGSIGFKLGESPLARVKKFSDLAFDNERILAKMFKGNETPYKPERITLSFKETATPLDRAVKFSNDASRIDAGLAKLFEGFKIKEKTMRAKPRIEVTKTDAPLDRSLRLSRLAGKNEKALEQMFGFNTQNKAGILSKRQRIDLNKSIMKEAGGEPLAKLFSKLEVSKMRAKKAKATEKPPQPADKGSGAGLVQIVKEQSKQSTSTTQRDSIIDLSAPLGLPPTSPFRLSRRKKQDEDSFMIIPTIPQNIEKQEGSSLLKAFVNMQSSTKAMALSKVGSSLKLFEQNAVLPKLTSRTFAKEFELSKNKPMTMLDIGIATQSEVKQKQGQQFAVDFPTDFPTKSDLVFDKGFDFDIIEDEIIIRRPPQSPIPDPPVVFGLSDKRRRRKSKKTKAYLREGQIKDLITVALGENNEIAKDFRKYFGKSF